MKKILLAFIIVFTFKVNAQTWDWAKSGNGTGFAEGTAACTDTIGNIFVTGYFSGPTITFGTYTLTNTSDTSGWNVFIVKYDAIGNVLWAKSAVGQNWGDQGNSVSTDATGNVFLTGSFQSPTITFGTYTLTNTNIDASVFTTKYDANGNVLWAKNAVGLTFDCSSSASTDIMGNLFVTGYFKSPTITFDTYTLTNAGSSNVFLAKYDANGNVLWAKSAIGANYDNCNSVSTDAVGNTFITGGFTSATITFGTYTLTNAGTNSNIFVAKYDASGNVLWAKNVGGIYDDYGFSVSSDVTGNVFLAGSFQSPSISFGTYTLTNVGSTPNIFLAKYDANGNVLWAKDIGEGTSIGADPILSTDAMGNVFITAGFSSSTITLGSYTFAVPVGSTDPMFIAKYDANGNVLCASVLASGGDDQCGVSADRFGNAYIGGDFMPNQFIVGAYTLNLTSTASSGENIFTTKWTPNCQQTGIEEFKNNEQVNLYPNPANSRIQVAYIDNIVSVTVYDVLGKEVFPPLGGMKGGVTPTSNTSKDGTIAGVTPTSNTSKDGTIAIDVSDLNNGVYFIKLENGEGSVTKKIVVQH